MPNIPLNVVNSLTKAIKAAVNGDELFVGHAEYKARLSVCDGCEFRTPNWQCQKCSCFVSIKARLRTENCPIGKWVGDNKAGQTDIKGGCSSCG